MNGILRFGLSELEFHVVDRGHIMQKDAQHYSALHKGNRYHLATRKLSSKGGMIRRTITE